MFWPVCFSNSRKQERACAGIWLYPGKTQGGQSVGRSKSRKRRETVRGTVGEDSEAVLPEPGSPGRGKRGKAPETRKNRTKDLRIAAG